MEVPMKLSDTQLIILSQAAQSDDRTTVMPDAIKGAVAHKVATKLIGSGLMEEVRSRGTMAVWRRDADNVAFSLRITKVGLAAINADEEGAASDQPEKVPAAPAQKKPAVASARAAAEPRSVSKVAKVLELLRRPVGATLAEIVKATGWLPHSARAALSGIRKAGTEVTLAKDDKGVGRYRVGSASSSAPSKKSKARS
jgi:hypothetical protein